MSSAETRAALVRATIALSTRVGNRGLTARAIATEAQVNQALIFYHFQGVPGLLREAYEDATRAMVAEHARDLSSVTSLDDLYAVGARLAERSRTDGSATLLTQVIADAHTDPEMAAVLGSTLMLWQEAVEDALRRLLSARGLERAVDVPATTRALAAATIGMIVLDAVPGQPLGDTLGSVRGLPGLVDRVLRRVPAPVARRVLRARV